MLLAAVLLSSVIDQVVPKVSSPLIQIALGLIIALLAVSPIEITFDPELFLVLLVAPLLFYDAKKADKAALLKHIKPVVSLAIGLVLATVLIIGYYVNWIIPSIPLAAAFALGAALGPTDAVAVSSLSKDVSLSKRQSAILNGEFLINDASGIVSFQFAIAAVVTGAFSLVDASASFVISFIGGIVIGVVLGFLANYAMRKARQRGFDNITFHVLFDLFLPFIVYLIAHAVGASGILAVVAAGLVSVLSPREIRPSVSRLNLVSNSVWQVFAFTLNGIIFVLLGAMLPAAMASTWESTQIDNLTLIGYIISITALLMFIRFVWILILDRVGLRKREDRGFKPMDIRTALVTTLSGPKGAITLSIVMAIPFMISADAGLIPFPQRSLIIFLASGVIILTLLLATFVVPLLAPKKEDALMDDEEFDTVLEVLRNVIEELTDRETAETRFATQSVIRSYNQRISRLKNNHDLEVEHNRELRVKVLRWEQDYILEMIESGEVDSVDGYQYLNRLAHIQNLIKHHSDNTWIAQNALRHLIRIAKSAWRHLRKVTPGGNSAEHMAAMRDLQIKTTEYAIKMLQAEMSTEAPTEDVSALILEYQRFLGRLRNTRPDVSSITKASSKITELGRLGLTLELEQIQSMYETERISRTTARRMRENVYLMQLDLEEQL